MLDILRGLGEIECNVHLGSDVCAGVLVTSHETDLHHETHKRDVADEVRV